MSCNYDTLACIWCSFTVMWIAKQHQWIEDSSSFCKMNGVMSTRCFSLMQAQASITHISRDVCIIHITQLYAFSCVKMPLGGIYDPKMGL